jgi:hypothetical protein
MDCIHLAYGPAVDACEHCKEHSCSIKMWGGSRLAAQILAFYNGLCSMKLVMK